MSSLPIIQVPSFIGPMALWQVSLFEGPVLLRWDPAGPLCWLVALALQAHPSPPPSLSRSLRKLCRRAMASAVISIAPCDIRVISILIGRVWSDPPLFHEL